MKTETGKPAADASLPLGPIGGRTRRSSFVGRRDGRRNWFSSSNLRDSGSSVASSSTERASIRHSIRDAVVDGGHKSSGEGGGPSAVFLFSLSLERIATNHSRWESVNSTQNDLEIAVTSLSEVSLVAEPHGN